jgi:hypothetical protein
MIPDRRKGGYLMTKAQRPAVTDEEPRLLEIEEMRLVVKFGDKKRYSDREFLRWTRYRDKAGNVRLYARLVSSVREGRRVRHQKIGSLYVCISEGGEWSAQQRSDAWGHLDYVLRRYSSASLATRSRSLRRRRPHGPETRACIPGQPPGPEREGLSIGD